MFDICDILGISTVLETIKEKCGKKEEKKEAYHSEQIKSKKYDFRPQTLEQYIGQENAKEQINLILAKIQQIKTQHILIFGTRGHGKSTLAYIMAKLLDFPIMTYVGGSFTKENLIDFLVKNADSIKPIILFCDEVHGMEKELAEYMYPILQDGILPEGNLKLRNFVFIGASTNPEILQKSFAPLVDRCNVVNLECYTANDIKQILKQINDNLYYKNIEENIYDIISENTRFNPRTAIQMFEDFLVCEDMSRVLKAHQIVKNSLNTNDIIVINHLAEIDKPVGVEVLAILTQQTKQTYMEIQEPFLIQRGYVSRTARGRIITNSGKELLINLK